LASATFFNRSQNNQKQKAPKKNLQGFATLLSKNTLMKNFTLICFFLFFTNELKAQKQFYFGLKSGIGFTFLGSWINGAHVKNSTVEKLKYNFTGGVELNVAINKKLSLESEIIFVDKGSKNISDDVAASWSSKITLGYIQFPELLRLNFNMGHNKKIKPFIELGPYFGYYLFYRGVSKISNYDPVITKSDQFDLFNKYDWGISGGFGLEKKIGLGKGNFEIRYDNSIINIRKNPTVTYQLGNSIPAVYVTDKVKALYSGLSFSLNFTYPLKIKK